MKINLLLTVIFFIVIILFIILNLLRKNKISVKYAIMWLLTIILSAVVLIIPHLLENLSKLLGFELVSNMVLCIFIMILLIITISMTVMITKQKKEITILIQEVGILKNEREKKK